MDIFPGYTRVTDVLFHFSGLKNIDASILKNAAERGTKIHEICSAIINDLGVVEINPWWQGYINSFKKWYKGQKFIEHPERWFCDKYKITGECDGIYLNEKDQLILVDFKTPANESKTWKLQGSAYSYLARLYGFHIHSIEFIKLSKNGSNPVVYRYEEDFPLFLNCLNVYNHFFKDAREETNSDYL